jgi:hypothetical protein
MQLRIPLTLLAIILATISGAAEEQLVNKVENAIRSAEPGWHYNRAVLNAPPPKVRSERLLVAGVWSHDLKTGTRDDVHMNLFQVDSEADAELSLSDIREGKVATGWKVTRFQIGDEGHLATFRNHERFEIHFRKGTIIVRISSNSLQLAKKFAQLVARQVDAT